MAQYLCLTNMNKELLEKLLSEGKTIRHISYEVGKSYTSVRHWIKKYNISLNRKRGPRNKSGLDKSKLSTLCQKSRARKRKIQFVKELGGKCSCCGYNKNWGALDFHHVDPKTKLIQLNSNSLGHFTEKVLREELKKCILLCSNCHREHHHTDKSLVDF